MALRSGDEQAGAVAASLCLIDTLILPCEDYLDAPCPLTKRYSSAIALLHVFVYETSKVAVFRTLIFKFHIADRGSDFSLVTGYSHWLVFVVYLSISIQITKHYKKLEHVIFNVFFTSNFIVLRCIVWSTDSNVNKP